MSSKGRTVIWSISFAIISGGLTIHATDSWSAGGAVLFGLWAVAGFCETT